MEDKEHELKVCNDILRELDKELTRIGRMRSDCNGAIESYSSKIVKLQEELFIVKGIAEEVDEKFDKLIINKKAIKFYKENIE